MKVTVPAQPDDDYVRMAIAEGARAKGCVVAP
jgi:hypothetical protein